MSRISSMNSKTSGLGLSGELPTPVGRLRITATDQGIVSILFPDECMDATDLAMTSHRLADFALTSSAKTQAPKLRVLQAISAQPRGEENSGTASSMTAAVNTAETHLQQALHQLTQYFSGKRQQFSLTLAPNGSAFQQQVWQALCEIPFAHSCSYSAIANHLQNPKAVRAVGAANGRNPIAIVVPCHRVIGANGSLTGYAGGLNRKLWLLQHELQYADA